MDSSLANQAINAALKHDWKLAVSLNQKVIKEDPDNVDAHNRLAKAYLQMGLKTKSELTYKKVLKLDKFNPIATKALEALKSYKVERSGHSRPTRKIEFTTAFIEEPGTTKTVTLTRISDATLISHLQPGDEVFMVAREHCVSITTSTGDTIGRLPDDLASRLHPLLKAGNSYRLWIKAAEANPKNPSKQVVRVFIREIHRAPKYKNTPSFPSVERLSYAAFTPPELVHTEKPDISTPEEDTGDNRIREDKMDDDNDNLPLSPIDDD